MRNGRFLVNLRVTLLSAGAGGFLCACGKEKQVELWKPLPRVRWEHVAEAAVPRVCDGYRILVPQPTRGLFPASMGVTRLALEVTDEEAKAVRPYLLTDPRNEFLQWNRALDDLMAVSEVFPIVERDLGGGEADPMQVLAASRALHARLGLIYAVNELGPHQAEMFGVLYDTRSAQPLACLHARARSTVLDDSENSEPPDPWTSDCLARVREMFERRVHACVRELVLHDVPEAVETPQGWTPAGPIQPVEWPPRHFQTGRGR